MQHFCYLSTIFLPLLINFWVAILILPWALTVIANLSLVSSEYSVCSILDFTSST